MPLFKIGDRVERTDALAPLWMKEGIVTNVIPNKHGIDWATQYEVDFGGEFKERLLYQSELRLIKAAPPYVSDFRQWQGSGREPITIREPSSEIHQADL